MKNYFFAATAIFMAVFAQAQMVQDGVWAIENYDWTEKPEVVKEDWITKQDEAVVGYKHLLEFRYEGDNTVLYELIHRRIWVGNEKVIQSYNKLYLPVYEEGTKTEIKARVLLPNGEINELNIDDIQTGKDEDDNEYNYFALDGVQEGSVVEYLFLTQIRPSFMGTRLTLQRSAPVYNLGFEVVAPENLVFKMKSYNALHQPERDTVLEEQNRWYIHQDTLVKFESEPSAYERSNMGYVVYALDRNLYNGKRDISSFGYTSSNIYNNVSITPSRSAEKQMKKVILASNIAAEESDALKIALLEDYIKRNFFIAESGGSELYNLDDILEFRKMSELGALRLYTSIYKQAGFPTQLVFTTDKSSTAFDASFETNLLIGENLLYFPDQDIFMQPTNLLSRLGFFSDDLRNTEGLFVYGIDIGGEMEGVGEVKKIPELNYKDNKALLNINWQLGANGDLGEIKMERHMWGAQTNLFQTLGNYVPEDDLEEFRKGILDWMYGEVDLEDYEVENFESENFPGKPLIVRAHFTDEVYTEPGSSSTIVKVGEIIGRQSEMYLTDSVRHFDVHQGFPKWYHRVIKVNVPEGYVLRNLESLKMNVSSGGENPSMLFDCNYTYENNVLEIVIDEWYQSGDYPADQFEVYRSVINAAADFNKKYVVLEAL